MGAYPSLPYGGVSALLRLWQNFLYRRLRMPESSTAKGWSSAFVHFRNGLLLGGLLLLVGRAQIGGWGSNLLAADTVWLDLPGTAAWLERHRHAFKLREVRTGLLCPKGFLTGVPSARLVGLYRYSQGLEWWWVVGEDTFCLRSRRVSVQRLKRHLVLLRGPCAKGPQEIELLAVFRPRARDLSEEEQRRGWQPFLPEAWEEDIIAPLALPQRYSPASVTAMSFLLERPEGEKSFILKEVRLYGRKSAFLPRDEIVVACPRKRLPEGFLLKLGRIWGTQAPYGYVVRVNDYYPASVGEGVLWVKLMEEGRCVRPVELVQADEHKLRPEWEAHLKGQKTPLLPYWEMR